MTGGTGAIGGELLCLLPQARIPAFRVPRGVLFEIATLSPGFAVDEDPEQLGEQLRVPRMHAHLRDRLEQKLTPVVNPRTRKRVEV